MIKFYIYTPQYNLAKYLNSVIEPNIPKQHMLSSTQEFIEQLSSLTLPNAHLFVSFDVQSLFTNIPLSEVIDLACDYVYKSGSVNCPKYDVRHFKKLLQFATSGEFLYKDLVYKRFDGVSMGSPLAPTLANLFLADLESKWVAASSAPVHYFRYVDDIFCIFDRNNDSHANFLDFLNAQHPN